MFVRPDSVPRYPVENYASFRGLGARLGAVTRIPHAHRDRVPTLDFAAARAVAASEAVDHDLGIGPGPVAQGDCISWGVAEVLPARSERCARSTMSTAVPKVERV